jgi:hypothetical protein
MVIPSELMEPEPNLEAIDLDSDGHESHSAEDFLADLQSLQTPSFKQGRRSEIEVIKEEEENEDEVSEPSMAGSGLEDNENGEEAEDEDVGEGESSPPSGRSGEDHSSNPSNCSKSSDNLFLSALSISELHLDDYPSLAKRTPSDSRHSHPAIYPPTPKTPKTPGSPLSPELFDVTNHAGQDGWAFLAKEGCCKHGVGEECKIWCSQSCQCGGADHGLVMPKVDVEGLRVEGFDWSAMREVTTAEATSERRGGVERDPPRKRKRRGEKSKKWEQSYLRGMGLGKQPSERKEGDDGTEGSKAKDKKSEDNVERDDGMRDKMAAVATTAVAAAAIGVLWYVEKTMASK